MFKCKKIYYFSGLKFYSWIVFGFKMQLMRNKNALCKFITVTESSKLKKKVHSLHSECTFW